MAAGTTSGSFNFSPSVAEMVRVAFSRIQIYGPAITITHIADARMAANLILQDISANRGPNLWAIDLLTIPLLPGIATYTLPANTIDLLDMYLRTLTPNSTTQNIGAPLTPLGPPGNPFVALPYGDPLLIEPSSGTLSCTAGSPIITLKWPANGLSVGAPIFWGCPISIGGLAISQFSFVTNVIDTNTVQFVASSPALESQNNQGGTPLFSTNSGSSTVGCILPGHGLSAGASFMVPISTLVGGLTLTGPYTVLAVNSPYEFTFNGGANATATASVFENGGQLNVATQAPGFAYTDVPLFPISRTDYSALAYKATPGRPTSIWVDRVVPPTITTYPVAPNAAASVEQTAPNLSNPGATSNQYYGFVAYRMRNLQDAIPVSGQVPDLPQRMWGAFIAEITAAMAEIYSPQQWAEKTAAAERAWQRAASADVERVTTVITPKFAGYYR